MDRRSEGPARENEDAPRRGRHRRSAASLRTDVVEPAARLCAAARVLVRHGGRLDGDAGDRLLAQMDQAADVLQQGVTDLVEDAAGRRTS
jgi:hypothetical protein